MGRYGRNDVVSVAVPVTAGGCGATHSRPVADGVAADEWDLEQACLTCSTALQGDPLWASMPAEIPETPDERMIREDAEKRGERQIKKSQERLSVQQGELNEKLVELLARSSGSEVAVPDQELIARMVAEQVQKVLASMRGAPAPAPDVVVPVDELTDEIPIASGVDLTRLHVRTLGKMCRDRGVDDKGGKADLVARLTAATED
jgi:hypothetical protein